MKKEKPIQIGRARMAREVSDSHKLLGCGHHHDSRVLRALYQVAFYQGAKAGMESLKGVLK